MSQAGSSPFRRWSREQLAMIVVCLAASLPYLRTIPDYFVQDDFGVVQLLGRKPWTTFPQWFVMPWMENIWGYTPDEIRPFPALSYQISALWGTAAPEGHHLLNIALHAVNGVLVLAIAHAAAGLTLTGATVAALVFVLLPLDAESVAWITGRVDSMPTLFYLASFLAYVRWRQQPAASNRNYRWSLVWFFLALFSKQNTITMMAALAAYDLILARRPIAFSWQWLRPYVPFALLTLGFLALRYFVLGEILRESQLSSQRFIAFGGIVQRHLQRIMFGDVGRASARIITFASVYAVAAILAAARADARTRGQAVRAFVYFGIVWIGLGLAPAVAAGYESPRHAYLAAVGWAIVIAVAFDVLWRTRIAAGMFWTRVWPRVVLAATAIILVAYGVRLHKVVRDWSHRAAVSHTAVRELEHQVIRAPEGTLVIAGAPVPSWEWAAPFMARPPYAKSDLTSRAFIITPRLLDCCRGQHWENDTRRRLRLWLAQPNANIVALNVTQDGQIRRLTSAEDPDLMTLVKLLPEIPSADNLDGAIVDILRKLVAGRGTIVRGPTF